MADSIGQTDTKTGIIEVTTDRKGLRFTGQFDLLGFENEPFEGEVETIVPGVGQLLDLVVLKKPDWLSFKDNEDGTGKFFGAPTTADVGDYHVLVELSDGKESVTQEYTVEIVEFPEPPVTAKIEDQSTVNIREVGPILVVASDPDEGDVLEFRVKSSNINVVSKDKMRFEINDLGQRELFIIPNPDFAGETKITIKVNDNQQHDVEESFTLTTSMPENYTLDLVQVGGGVIRVSPEDSKFVEGSVVTVSALPEKGFIFEGWAGDLSGLDSPVSLLMNKGKSVRAKFYNPLPQIVSINLPTKALAKKTATFNATVTDIDDDNLSLSWDLGDGTKKSGNTVVHSYQASGEYKVILTVTDSNGASSSMEEFIEVDDDFAVLQFASAPVVEVLENDSYVYTVNTVKPGTGQVLNLEAKVKPDWISFKNNGDGTAALSGKPRNDQVGIHPVELVLSDQRGSLVQSFSVEVINVNQAPSISAIADAVIRRDTSFGPVSFTVSDPDKGNVMKVAALSSNQTLVPDSSINVSESDEGWSLSVIPADNSIGQAVVTLVVSDGTVEVQEKLLLTVEPPPVYKFVLNQPKGGLLKVEPDAAEFEEARQRMKAEVEESLVDLVMNEDASFFVFSIDLNMLAAVSEALEVAISARVGRQAEGEEFVARMKERGR